MFLTRSLAVFSLLVVGACAGSPAAPLQADQQAKRFDRPSAEKSALYVYRSNLMGFARPISVAVAGGPAAQLGYNTFILVEGPPGPVEVGCRVGDNAGSSQVEMQDGQTRFVEVSMKIGLLLPGCEVTEVPADRGQAAVLAARRVERQ